MVLRGLTTLDLLGKLHAVNQNQVISWILKCQHDSGKSCFFDCGGMISLTTLYLDATGLQNEDGSFSSLTQGFHTKMHIQLLASSKVLVGSFDMVSSIRLSNLNTLLSQVELFGTRYEEACVASTLQGLWAFV